MKFGFELEEFYATSEGVVTPVPTSIPHDDCGWLVEYRGQPHYDVFQAVGSVLAEQKRVLKLIPEGFKTLRENHLEVPRKVKLAARRTYVKGILAYENLYGKTPSKLDHAGVHISLTNERILSIWDKSAKSSYNYAVREMWDFPSFVKAMDKRFAQAIREAKRVPGFYELKSDGRFEYRSLPATIDLWEVAEFVTSYRF